MDRKGGLAYSFGDYKIERRIRTLMKMKKLCLLLGAALFLVILPCNVLAVDDSVTITVVDDLGMREDMGDSNLSSLPDMLFQNIGGSKYNREAWFRFNLSQISIPAGKMIKTAICKIYITGNLSNVGTIGATSDTDISLYSLTSSEYDASTLTWNTANRPTKNAVIAKSTLPKQADFTEGYYSFDISEYLQAKETLTGLEAFSFYPDGYKVSGTVAGIEKGAEYAAKIEVTFAEKSEDIIPMIDAALVRQDAPVAGYTNDSCFADYDTYGAYDIQNNGNSASNRRAYFMFNLGNITVPAGKVITSATLQIYFSRNYNKTDTKVRIYNVDDDSWFGSTMSWNNAPAWEDALSCATVVPYLNNSSVVEKYIDFDVTAYVADQYATDDTGLISFSAYPDVKRTSGALSLYSGMLTTEAMKPRIKITYGDAAEMTFGEGAFCHGTLTGEMTTSFPKSGLKFLRIPAAGAMADPVETKLFIAQYDTAGKLVGLVQKEITLRSANGDAPYILSFYPPYTKGDYVIKAYIWNKDCQPMTPGIMAQATTLAE